MANNLPRAYRVASLELTIALSEMAKSLGTPAFSDTFWKVQQASERCKRMRVAVDRSARRLTSHRKPPGVADPDAAGSRDTVAS
jgi:hypothetical protein